jgi:SAM-dependent methyltransferase
MPTSQQPEEGQAIMIERILAGCCHKVLDVGAGDGKWGKLLADLVPCCVALEIWPDYVKKYHLDNIYDDVILGDVIRFDMFKQFDVVIFGDVLEHMKRADAMTVTHRIKQAGVRAYLTIPISECIQDGKVYGNPYETHLDHWSHDDLIAVGWKLLHRGMNEAKTVEIGTYEWIK